MDFDQLRSFVVVARAGSFTKAAQERGLSQPGISRQIQRLEAELGVQLFQRNQGTTRLTADGERFLAYAESALAAHTAMLATLHRPAEIEGVLRIIASTTPGAYLVPRLVARFQSRHPRVRPEIAIADSAAVLAAVSAGQWDLGFVGGSVATENLRSLAIAEDEIVLAVPASHPLAGEKAVSLRQLADLPFLEREIGSGTVESLNHALARRRLRLPPRRVIMVLSSSQAMIEAVRQGLGVGFVSTLALAEAGADVVGVRLAEVSTRRQLSLVYRSAWSLPPAAAAFVRSLEERGELLE